MNLFGFTKQEYDIIRVDRRQRQMCIRDSIYIDEFVRIYKTGI